MTVNEQQNSKSMIIGMIKLLRPYQYYKNVLIFLGFVFAKQLTNWSVHFILLLIGFIGLCSVSSLNYVLNDLKDIQQDKLHPEKKKRPLPSGVVPVKVAIMMVAVLLLASLAVCLIVGPQFAAVCLLIFLTSQIYSFYFKQIIFADVSLVALNYVWRAVAGVVIIGEKISPWLITLGFLFALFLALCKRKGDLLLLGDEAVNHKKVFEHYNLRLIDQATSIVSATMITSYSLYTFESETFDIANVQIQIFTIPLVTFCIFRYLYLLEKGGKLARRPELIFIDRQIVLCGFLAGTITVVSLYMDEIIIYWNGLMG